MGLLDEAIRQHLELKRQHGASDEELHMQEQEALGPVRREPAEPVAESPVAGEPLAEHVPEQDLEEAFEPPPAQAGADAPVYDEAPAEEVAAAAPLDEPPDEGLHEPIDPYGDPDAPGIGPATEALHDEEDLDSSVSEETPSSGFEAVQDPAPPLEEDEAEDDEGEDDEGEDDVLEETPEFLQETPDHDRLWFEQKPPRDFDFDDE